MQRTEHTEDPEAATRIHLYKMLVGQELSSLGELLKIASRLYRAADQEDQTDATPTVTIAYLGDVLSAIRLGNSFTSSEELETYLPRVISFLRQPSQQRSEELQEVAGYLDHLETALALLNSKNVSQSELEAQGDKTEQIKSFVQKHK